MDLSCSLWSCSIGNLPDRSMSPQLGRSSFSRPAAAAALCHIPLTLSHPSNPKHPKHTYVICLSRGHQFFFQRKESGDHFKMNECGILRPIHCQGHYLLHWCWWKGQLIQTQNVELTRHFHCGFALRDIVEFTCTQSGSVQMRGRSLQSSADAASLRASKHAATPERQQLNPQTSDLKCHLPGFRFRPKMYSSFLGKKSLKVSF